MEKTYPSNCECNHTLGQVIYGELEVFEFHEQIA